MISLKQKANEHELKTQQESKIYSLEEETIKIRGECMKIKETCDKQEIQIGKAPYIFNVSWK